MGTEIELKLALDPQNVGVFLKMPFIDEFMLHPPEEKDLFTQYYDTDDYLLWTHGTSLRMRRDGPRFVQTLKQKGKSVNGLSKRNEWEWPRSDSSLDVSLIPDVLPPNVREALPGLKPMFNTVFKRILWLLELPENYFEKGQSGATVEMVLDQGRIEAATPVENQTELILEIELELKRGSAEALIHLSKKIAECLPVRPSNVSKAARGYRLLGMVHADDR